MGETLEIDESTRSIPDASSPAQGEGPTPRLSKVEREGFIDWRTIDPATIQGENIPVEELRHFREKIDELLRFGEGQYVLIASREIISYGADLESLVRHAERDFRGQSFLIKKVVRFEPIHTAGGLVG